MFHNMCFLDIFLQWIVNMVKAIGVAGGDGVIISVFSLCDGSAATGDLN